MARSEHYSEGRVPLHTLRADIDYGFKEAKTTFGRIGVKVPINKGEIMPRSSRSPRASGTERDEPARPRPGRSPARAAPAGRSPAEELRDEGATMLLPKRVKHSEAPARPHVGIAKGGTDVSSASSASRRSNPAGITNRQIEAARIAMTRYIKRGGKVWTQHLPAEAGRPEGGRDPHGRRQGISPRSGSPWSSRARSCSSWPASASRWPARPMRLASRHKLPIKCKFVTREGDLFEG